MVLLEFQYLSGENIPEGGACIVYLFIGVVGHFPSTLAASMLFFRCRGVAHTMSWGDSRKYGENFVPKGGSVSCLSRRLVSRLLPCKANLGHPG